MKCKIIKPIENTVIKVTEDTQFVLVFDNFSDDIHYSATFEFETQGVTAEIIGVYMLKDHQSLNLTTVAVHKVPNTACNTNIKCVLGDSAKSFYIGKIKIEKKAQQTSSFLHDSVLVIGDKTKNRSDPILEIDADDVKASHGATTGRIDKMQLYYLQSRGFGYDEAQNIIISGFFESLVSTIADDRIKISLQKMLTG